MRLGPMDGSCDARCMSIPQVMKWSLLVGTLSAGCLGNTDAEPRAELRTIGLEPIELESIGGSSSLDGSSTSEGTGTTGSTSVVVVTETDEGGEETGEPEWESEVAQVDSWCHEDGKCDCWQRFRCYETNDCSGPYAIDSNGVCATVQYADQTVCAQGNEHTTRCAEWCDGAVGGLPGSCYTLTCTTSEDCTSPGPIGEIGVAD